MADSKGVITAVGRRKLCMAHAGEIVLPPITKMAWGDGGIDENGEPKATTGNEVGLYSMVMEKDIEGYGFIVDEKTGEKTTCRYTSTLGKGEATGKRISEMGLIDAEGDLISYRTFMEKGKDGDIPQVYDMDEIF